MSRKLALFAATGATAALTLAGAAAARQYEEQANPPGTLQSGPLQQYHNESQPPQQQGVPNRNVPTRHYQQFQAGYTETCAYRNGPRAGVTVDYNGTPGAQPVRVGARCADMQGSNGVAVVPGTAGTAVRPGEGRGEQGRHYQRFDERAAQVGFDAQGHVRPGYTLTCRFTRGPRSGTSFNFEGVLGAMPVRIGAACSDAASTGLGVAPNTGRHADHPL